MIRKNGGSGNFHFRRLTAKMTTNDELCNAAMCAYHLRTKES
jgi:hypothetical protein